MNNFRLLYPLTYQNNQSDKITDNKFISNLNIDGLISTYEDKRDGIYEESLDELFTTNEEVCQYRLDIMEDMFQEPLIIQLFTEAQPMIGDMYELRKTKSDRDDIETNLYSLKEIECYLSLVDLFGTYMQKINPKSEGFIILKRLIDETITNKEYQNLKIESTLMVKKVSSIKSITLGINIDTGKMTAKEAGVVSINSEVFRSGDIVDRLLNLNLKKDEFTCITPFVSSKAIHQKDSTVLNQIVKDALTRLYEKALKSFRPSVEMYINCNTNLFISIYKDIKFLIKAYHLFQDLISKGYPICKPKILPKPSRKCIIVDGYNPIIAQTLVDEHIITNSVSFDENGMFYIVTGPNHGGKSVFADSIGIIQALFQLGLYVPAKSAQISMTDNIFTHFPVENSENIGNGRLGEECSRLSSILEELTEYSLLIMDESFSSTSSSEAEYIANEVLESIGAIGCRGLFVTHMHALCTKLDDINSYPQVKIKIDNLVAQMSEASNGKRTYKITRTLPDGLSYAKDIAQKYGLVFETIIKKNKKYQISKLDNNNNNNNNNNK